MSSTYTPRVLRPIRTLVRTPMNTMSRAGHQAIFFLRTLGAIPLTFTHYRKEVFRLVKDVTWGNGSIVVGGGTVMVVIILSALGGATVGLEVYSNLNILGIGPLTGAISAIASTREITPILAVLGFACQAGCRFTAQLGAMRISEEIDALEAVAIRPLPYLVTTRVLAAVIAIVPLYSLGLAASYISAKVTVLLLGGLPPGTYSHYFSLFLVPNDVIYSFGKAIVLVLLTTFIQCYYGFFAAGGPEGVGVASGRAIKMSIIVLVSVSLLMTLGVWGLTGGAARLSG